MSKQLELVKYLLRNIGFSKSLSFIVMILMTMGIHRDVLFHMLSHVELSHEQRNALFLASLQIRTFLMLARCKRQFWMKKSVGRNHGSDLFHFQNLFSHFQMRVSINMVDLCDATFGDRGNFRFYADKGMFICNGMDMVSFDLLKGNILLNPQQFWSILKMDRGELYLHKTRILINQGLVLLGNSSICPLITKPDLIEKSFRLWKKKAFIGDEYGKPIHVEPEFSRCEEDVMILFLFFLARDTTFMKDFMVTKNLLETHLISQEVTTAMKMILYTHCNGAQGLDDSANLVHKSYTIFDYIKFFASRSYKTMWEPSFWFIYLNNASRPTLVTRNKLEYRNKFECFMEVLWLFLNDPSNLQDLV
jgi:hypothetical protein